MSVDYVYLPGIDSFEIRREHPANVKLLCKGDSEKVKRTTKYTVLFGFVGGGAFNSCKIKDIQRLQEKKP